jgi:hypothetical protein
MLITKRLAVVAVNAQKRVFRADNFRNSKRQPAGPCQIAPMASVNCRAFEKHARAFSGKVADFSGSKRDQIKDLEHFSDSTKR